MNHRARRWYTAWFNLEKPWKLWETHFGNNFLAIDGSTLNTQEWFLSRYCSQYKPYDMTHGKIRISPGLKWSKFKSFWEFQNSSTRILSSITARDNFSASSPLVRAVWAVGKDDPPDTILNIIFMTSLEISFSRLIEIWHNLWTKHLTGTTDYSQMIVSGRMDYRKTLCSWAYLESRQSKLAKSYLDNWGRPR